MERIDKNNYEAYWLDYLEGNLDKASIESMFAFFKLHPELKPNLTKEDLFEISAIDEIQLDKSSLLHHADELEEKMVFLLDNELEEEEAVNLYSLMSKDPARRKTFDEYTKIRLEADANISFKNRLALKKSPLPDEMLIAYCEGLLSNNENEHVKNTLAIDDTTAYQVKLYNASKICADNSVVYPNKEDLKRKEAKVFWLNTYFIPASIAAAILLFFTIRSFTKVDTSSQNIPLAFKTNEHVHNTALATHTLSLPAKIKVKMALNSSNQNTVITPQQNTTIIENKILSKDNNIAINDSAGKKSISQPELTTDEYAYDKIAINIYNESDPLNNINSTKKPTNFLAAQINKNVWGESAKNETQTEEAKKIRGFDFVGMIGKAFKKLGSKRSDAKKIENDEDNSTEYIVTLGGLSLKKTVRN